MVRPTPTPLRVVDDQHLTRFAVAVAVERLEVEEQTLFLQEATDEFEVGLAVLNAVFPPREVTPVDVDFERSFALVHVRLAQHLLDHRDGVEVLKAPVVASERERSEGRRDDHAREPTAGRGAAVDDAPEEPAHRVEALLSAAQRHRASAPEERVRVGAEVAVGEEQRRG